ncbi:growth inhibitor PemK [Candidatus Pacearchaeota archaeon]|nr:growth inhibitor PemK [Candidatus Pacearchaeota archaeon]|tara:strand:+ start:669 stop:1010 length:342 start_codon:yes stop_codon:yes gene_type:complete
MERFVDYEKGDVVIFKFPFAEGEKVKKRPSLVVAKLKGNSVILCQITGQPRPDPNILELKKSEFQSGGISRDSYIRPSVLFTINKSRINYKAGKLKQEKIKQVEKEIVKVFTQ